MKNLFDFGIILNFSVTQNHGTAFSKGSQLCIEVTWKQLWSETYTCKRFSKAI